MQAIKAIIFFKWEVLINSGFSGQPQTYRDQSLITVKGARQKGPWQREMKFKPWMCLYCTVRQQQTVQYRGPVTSPSPPSPYSHHSSICLINPWRRAYASRGPIPCETLPCESLLLDKTFNLRIFDCMVFCKWYILDRSYGDFDLHVSSLGWWYAVLSRDASAVAVSWRSQAPRILQGNN